MNRDYVDPFFKSLDELMQSVVVKEVEECRKIFHDIETMYHGQLIDEDYLGQMRDWSILGSRIVGAEGKL